MKYQPDHNVIESFRLWFNDHLARNGEAYKNVTGILEKVNGPQMTDANGVGYNQWIVPDSQWIYDYSIANVVVPSGVTINGRYETNVKIDTDNGGVWIPNSLIPTNVSVYASMKDFEVRTSTQNEETILFGESAGQRFGADTSDATPNEVGFPYVYLKYNVGRAQGLGFGGLQVTSPQIRAICVADNTYLFDGIMSLFRDTSESYFTVLSPGVFPFDEFGSLRGPFDYRAIIAQNRNHLFYIKAVTFSPFNEEVNYRIAKNAIGGFLDFKLESIGYSHARFV